MNLKGHLRGRGQHRMASQSAHEVLKRLIFDLIEEVLARLNAFQLERLGLSERTQLDGRMDAAGPAAHRSQVGAGQRGTPDPRRARADAERLERRDDDLYAARIAVHGGATSGSLRVRAFTHLDPLEVVDADSRMVSPGARGRVLLTSLLHTALPLIRFDLSDYATLGKAGLRPIRCSPSTGRFGFAAGAPGMVAS